MSFDSEENLSHILAYQLQPALILPCARHFSFLMEMNAVIVSIIVQLTKKKRE